MVSPVRRALPLAMLLAVAAAASGCGGSSSGGAVNAPVIGAARTFKLAGFQPSHAVRPGTPTKVTFDIQQPSGQPLTSYKTGTGPHTGVHLIIVRDDLGAIIHRHPPVQPNGTISLPVTFPSAGRWHVLVDAYPQLANGLPNFQLFDTINVAGAYKPRRLPPFKPTVDVGGYRFTLHGTPHLKAIQPAFLKVTVTDPQGRPAGFTPWYGALAHAIFFREGSLDYFHTHVCGAGATNCTSVFAGKKVSGQSTTPGILSVGVLLPTAGTWRLFLQTKVGGQVRTVPYTLHVT